MGYFLCEKHFDHFKIRFLIIKRAYLYKDLRVINSSICFLLEDNSI